MATVGVNGLKKQWIQEIQTSFEWGFVRGSSLISFHCRYIVDANRQAALYGGRMTASRLFHVGQVTSDAVEQLHK